MKPFILIDWERPFLPALAELLAETHGSDFRNLYLLFPHRRPIRSLQQLLLEAAGGKALLPPRMSAVNAWIDDVAVAFFPGRRMLGTLDRVHLLHRVVLDLSSTGSAFSGKLGRMAADIRDFFPWALELDNLMEELLRTGVTPKRTSQDAMEPFAAAILEGLGDIHAAYFRALKESDATTPGFNAKLAASLVDDAPVGLAEHVAGQNLVCAGLYAMSGCEEKLLRFLWEQGLAEMVLPVDLEITSGGGHSSCREIAERMKAWQASSITHESSTVPLQPLRISFIEGYDLHSQLQALREDMDAGGDALTAVVLPDESALLPALHRFHDKVVNVSMGYPLARTPLFRLLELPALLLDTAKADGRLHRKGLTALVRHPFIRRGFGEDFAALLGRFEGHMRAGGIFAAPHEWLKSLDEEDSSEELKAHFEELLRTFVHNFRNIQTLRDAGDALLQVCVFLHAGSPTSAAEEHSEAGTRWELHPVDAECLHRLVTVIIPQLTESALADAPLGRDAVLAVLRQFLERERVPFEAEPLVDLQILGMLEARLLSFDRLYVLDASDDKIPGHKAYEPLLPGSLRTAMGLPDEDDGKLVQAYNLHAMVRQAGRAAMLYPQGAGNTGGDEGVAVSMRSRFIEEFVWQEEQARVSLAEKRAEGWDDFIQVVDVRLRAVTPRHADLPKPPEVAEALRKRLSEGISPSFLDAYLKCPVRFFHEHIAGIRAGDTVEETGDPRALGSIVHESLQRYFAEYLGRTVRGSDLPQQPLVDIFRERFRAHPSTDMMSVDARLAVEASAQRRLRRLLQHTPEGILLAVEYTLKTDLRCGGLGVPVTCRIDRMDQRAHKDGEDVYILDYKTGVIPRVDAEHFCDEFFLQSLASAGDASPPNEMFHELAEKLESIQLPLYLYALQDTSLPEALQASWVDLRDDCKEKPLFKKTGLDERREYIRHGVPAIIDFLLRHMLHAESFPARPGKQCEYCPYSGPCLRETFEE